MKTSLMLAAVLSMTAATASIAHGAGNATDPTVKARHGYFQMVGYNFGGLVSMVKGETAYDPALASSLAGNMQALSDMYVLNLFAGGTDNASLPGQTRATPNIWSDLNGFLAKYDQYGAAVDGLVAAAGGGQGALAGAVGQVGATCKGCHENYRAQNF